MYQKRLHCLVVIGLGVSPAFAQFDSGSDGSDGTLDCTWLAKDAAFDCAANCTNAAQCTFVVDLAAADSDPATRWDTPGGDLDGD